MLRAIPLPDETVWSLKYSRRDYSNEFQERMRLFVLDKQVPEASDELDKLINDAEIEYVVSKLDCGRC